VTVSKLRFLGQNSAESGIYSAEYKKAPMVGGELHGSMEDGL
jgi:hypothetical protein